ncbi:MAG: WYL domain-containing protein [Oscillospiraceae bacterium]|nr:WYL domain-containing protein [Oscillospiraceae bacterium]
MLEMVYHKTMNMIMILGVLLKYSDINNPIHSQVKIQKLIEQEYGVKINRIKTIGENLRELRDFLKHAKFGYTLEYEVERTRHGKNGEETLYFDWYIERDISTAELIPLIDGLLFSKYIPYSECKKLINKLERISSVHFKRDPKLPNTKSENKNLFLTVEVLSEAISKEKRVAFNFLTYGTDTKEPLRVYLDDDGTPHEYKVSPYRIVITNGRYYLICAHNKGDDLFHYRLDFIMNIRFMKKDEDGEDSNKNYIPNRPINEFKDHVSKSNQNELDLAKYMREHIYMYSGKSVAVQFIANKAVYPGIIFSIRDWFGDEVLFRNETRDKVEVHVTVNENAMRQDNRMKS